MLKVLSAVLGAAAARPPSAAPLEGVPSDTAVRDLPSLPMRSVLPARRRVSEAREARDRENPMALAYPTQSARAALLDACLARADERARLSTIAAASE